MSRNLVGEVEVVDDDKRDPLDLVEIPDDYLYSEDDLYGRIDKSQESLD